MPDKLYKQVVSIIQEYLGPAAERFVDRIITSHLKKKPNQLSAQDIPQLSEWVKVSLGLLTEDRAMVDDCQKKILKLARS